MMNFKMACRGEKKASLISLYPEIFYQTRMKSVLVSAPEQICMGLIQFLTEVVAYQKIIADLVLF